MLIQIFLLLILLAAMIMTRKRTKQRALSRLEGYGWMLVWLLAAALVIKPDISTWFARTLGVGRGVDLVVYTAIIILLILVFRLHVAHEQLERQLTELVRKEALQTVPEPVSAPTADQSSEREAA
ncbi:MAG TPA: DUF2304 domain-containing protein [Patescibacteria group bacterium]|nr:DUF2304 domain-containing protein [Patescibacteria group bacterium]